MAISKLFQDFKPWMVAQNLTVLASVRLRVRFSSRFRSGPSPMTQ
jgi:hypothetical protein